MFKRNLTLCIVCSAGGHLTEAMLSLEGVEFDKYFVTYKLLHTANSLVDQQVYYITNPHKNPFKYATSFIQSLRLYMKKRPKFILSTGSGMAIATCLIGKVFGSQVIFIETGARIHAPSLTGRLMYHFSDLFIVQWEQLLEYFPSAIYGGSLL